MARLKFQCQDRDGNLVEFETSEHEGKELLASYSQYVKWLTDNGFTLLKARRGSKPKVRFDGKLCPICQSPVYDNRTKKQSGEWKATAPDFTCSNKQCTGGTAKDGTRKPWAVWPDQWEIVPTT